MYNLFLIMQIKYGSKIITKLTLMPYYFSLIALIFFLGMETVEEFVPEEFLFSTKDYTKDTITGRRIWILMFWLRQLAWLCFIGIRVFEDTVLAMFVEF